MRHIYTGFSKDQNGKIIQDATVSVYLTGTSTPASIYTLPLGIASLYSTGIITMSGIAVTGQKFVVGSRTFTWKTLRVVAGEVTIGATASAAVTNIVTAITADLTEVTAVDYIGDTVLVTSVGTGSGANAIPFCNTNSSNMSFNGSGTLFGAAVNSVTSDNNGQFKFYIDRFDYDNEQCFDLAVSKAVSSTASYGNATISNVSVDSPVLGTYSLITDKTVTTHLVIPKGVIYSIPTTKTLTINGSLEAGLYQIFSLTGTGKVAGLKEAKPEWFLTNTTPGTTDMTVAIQSAIDATAANGKIIGSGTYKTSDWIWARTSNIVYDFFNAEFTGFGCVIVKDPDNVTVIPENIRILGGEYRPDATADVYPLANRNGLAVVIGTNITIINPRIFPTMGARGLSIQTDTSVGTAPTYANIRRIRVYGVEIYGDGNAASGVDVGLAGADNMIQDVYVEGFVSGCRLGVNVFTGAPTQTMDSINLDLTIRDATVQVGSIICLKNSNVRINSINATAIGIHMYQFRNCKFDLSVHGTGASLATAVQLVDSAVDSDNVEFNIKVQATGGNKWTVGLKPYMSNAVYPNVQIDGATLGIDIEGFKSSWGLVLLRNCTTTVNDFTRTADNWGEVIDLGTGVGATQLYGTDQSLMKTDIPTFATLKLSNLTDAFFPVSSSVEMVSNGAFTSATTDWTPSNSTLASVAGGQSGNCLEITRTGGTDQFAIQTIPGLIVGVTYKLSGWVKSGTSGNESFILRYQKTSDSIGSYVTGITSGTWTNYTISFVALETSYDVVLYKYTATIGTMLFDTVSLKAVGFVNSPLSVKAGGVINVTSLPSYANNAAALAGGLVTGDIYRSGGDPDAICIVKP